VTWFEDVSIGEGRELGTHRFTEEEIIAFARQFDPQPFHIDPEAARQSHFGGLVASGWHTVAIWMKCNIAARGPREAEGQGPSPGFTDLRWPAPVRPGDVVRFRITPIERLERPAWGIVRSRCEGTNQDGTLVLSFVGEVIHFRRAHHPHGN
jgi:acyl dehydratase